MITYTMETMNVSTRPDPDQRAGNSLWPLIKKNRENYCTRRRLFDSHSSIFKCWYINNNFLNLKMNCYCLQINQWKFLIRNKSNIFITTSRSSSTWPNCYTLSLQVVHMYIKHRQKTKIKVRNKSQFIKSDDSLYFINHCFFFRKPPCKSKQETFFKKKSMYKGNNTLYILRNTQTHNCSSKRGSRSLTHLE